MNIMLWSLGALVTGFVLDIVFGDPYNFPHIVRWMGSLISFLEKLLRKVFPATEKGEKAGGVLIVFVMVLICTGTPFALLVLCYRTAPIMGFVLESFLCWQCLATKSLKAESMKVYNSLVNNDVEDARKNVSMIVGRDVATLDKEGITRAAVETVAENASDGVAAPLLFMMLGGAPLGCFYKVVNTMDSMIGYKNDNYKNFGRAAAKLDDVLNYIPSRICALFIIISAFLMKYNAKTAFSIWRRDRRKHASPNSAQTEAACAGALGVRLAGPIVYSGELRDKPYLGDDVRPVSANDIVNANRLMYGASILTLVISLLFRFLCLGAMFYAAV